MILGDYDYNILENCPMTDTCNTYALHNLVLEPTCFKSINPTLLDVILVTKPKRFTKVLYCSCWLSDFHNIVCVSTKLSLPRRNDRRILYRSFKHFDELHFNADLLRATHNLIYHSTDVNSCLERNLPEGITCRNWQARPAEIKSNSLPASRSYEPRMAQNQP